jgi:HPt (histidine-containing phosphotransfer) domain-containing protein
MEAALLHPALAMGRLQGNQALYRRVLRLFRADAPRRLESLQTALQANDLTTIEREAHTLKSLGTTIGAETLAEAARRVEEVARAHHQAALPPLVETLVVSVERVQAFLATYPEAQDVSPSTHTQP